MRLPSTHANPLLIETLKGFSKAGQIHLDYLNYLLIQAVVVFLWWPKSTIQRQLETESDPNTLLALIIIVGITLSYYSLRVGAEEALLPGQHALREWALATPVKLDRIVRGYIYSHIVLMLYALLLSSPLLLMAYTVTAVALPTLVWSLSTVLLQAMFYRLLGAALYLQIGHHETWMFLALRAVFVIIYGIGFTIPLISHILLSSQLLNPSDVLVTDADAYQILPTYMLIYGVSCVLLAGLIYLLLARQRRWSVNGD